MIDPVNTPLGVIVKSVEGLPKLPELGPVKVYEVAITLGVTEFEGEDGALVRSAELVAVTVKVYAVPLVKPDTVIGDVAPEAVIDPGFEVTVYPVIGEPPLDEGAVNETVACVSPGTAVTPVGAPGATGFTV